MENGNADEGILGLMITSGPEFSNTTKGMLHTMVSFIELYFYNQSINATPVTLFFFLIECIFRDHDNSFSSYSSTHCRTTSREDLGYSSPSF